MSLTPRQREYTRYNAMRSRCHNPNHKHYANYGGRGITLCDRWLIGDGNKSGFECFLEDMGPRPEGMTLDRIDNDGPYSPENCRWATMREQHCNKRTNRMVTFRGETKPLPVWEEQFGLGENVFENRMKRGWTVERALTTPVLTYHEKLRRGYFSSQAHHASLMAARAAKVAKRIARPA